MHDASDGRIGYVHVPDMMSTGWAEFNRDLRREIARDALVVDTRDNGGGHVSELVIERLARRPLGGDVSRHAAEDTYPSGAPRGPMVSLANEHAGSDGDIVNEAFHELGLGTIVGVRTWGGVIGIDGRYHLVDGDGRHPAAVLVLVPRCRLGSRELRRRPGHRGAAPAAGLGQRATIRS